MVRTLSRAILVGAVLMLVAVPASPASAAVSVTRADLVGSRLRVEGSGAVPNASVTVDGALLTRADGAGAFKGEKDPFTSASCIVTVSDGSTSKQATLSGCTPTSPPSAAPPAPAPVSPANGASVVVPFTISWSAVSDPDGIVAYNWQVSPSSAFSPVIQQSSTSGATQATVSGLANGAYFWRVQAVDGAFTQGAWSAPSGVTVTGVGPGTPGTPTLGPPQAGTQFHPFESVTFTWTPAAGAASYVFEADKDPNFPVGSRVHFDNITATTTSIVIGDFCGGCEQGSYVARVYAVAADGTRGVPSNSVGFGIFYTAPLPPPPTALAPANGATVSLPVALDWSDVPNPQPSGYEVEIARDSAFTDIEEHIPQLNDSTRTVLSLTAGTKFWHVRSHQGNASPTTAAVTDWSATRSFTVAGGTAGVASVSLASASVFSGQQVSGSVQLTTAAPAGGAVVGLSVSDPNAAGTLPGTVTVPAGVAFAQFQFVVGQVAAAAQVTLTATLGTSSASFPFTVSPPSLKSLSTASSLTGGAPAGAIVMLNGQAPPGGAVVSLASNSAAASPPATVTVPAGDASVSFTFPTSAVTANTTVTLTATYNGGSVPAQITLTPQQPPATLTLDPTTTTGTSGSSGTVTLASPPPNDVQVLLASSNTTIARTPPYVTVPAGATAGGFLVFTSAPAAPTTVTITASGAGVTKTASLTVNPFPTGPLPAPTLLAPANDARFAVGQLVSFDWTDVSGAVSYTIQVSSSSTFSTTVLSQVVTPSQFATSSLPKATLFWRVRATDSGGNPGTWSAARSFRIG